METNHNPAQGERPAHLIISTPEQSEIQTEQQTSEQPLLYDPAKAARIAECLCELLDPAYILLFGAVANRLCQQRIARYEQRAV